MFESFSLRTDSGGPGEFRGGLGLERRYLMLAPCRISTRIERTLSPAWGMNGGGEGQPGDARSSNAPTARPKTRSRKW